MGRGRLSLQPWEGCLDASRALPTILPTGQDWERGEGVGWVGLSLLMESLLFSEF